MRIPLLLPCLAALALSPAPALAWGSEGHQVVALIARQYLKPEARRRVDAILATDQDTLTAPDMAARATWADAWRREHKDTENWHFADIELDDGDLAKACPESPMSDAPASAGPATECIVTKLEQFARELAAPATRTDRHSVEPDHCGGEERESGEVDCASLVARGKPTEVFEAVEASFDAVALLVGDSVMRDCDLAGAV